MATGAAADAGGVGAGGGAEAAWSFAPSPSESAPGAAAAAGAGAGAGGGGVSGSVVSAYLPLARSASNPLATPARSVWLSALGLAGTLARLGYGASAFGGGGRAWAIGPPSMSCHQSTGFIVAGIEQPACSSTAVMASARGRPARRRS